MAVTLPLYVNSKSRSTYSISKVVERTGLSTDTLRYYEKIRTALFLFIVN
ncbi:MerR family DNA-binding transcriptional regulator [Brevibacillus formosus]|nr:MerR family DNA-binding transcriptional regulator [Brevibacillus formosus]